MVAFRHRVKSPGWLANPILNYLILGKHNQEFLDNSGIHVFKYFMPELLVIYGIDKGNQCWVLLVADKIMLIYNLVTLLCAWSQFCRS